MNDFEQTLDEAIMAAVWKILSKYNAFAQGSILRDARKDIIGINTAIAISLKKPEDWQKDLYFKWIE